MIVFGFGFFVIVIAVCVWDSKKNLMMYIFSPSVYLVVSPLALLDECKRMMGARWRSNCARDVWDLGYQGMCTKAIHSMSKAQDGIFAAGMTLGG